jgi:hypothetical protein
MIEEKVIKRRSRSGSIAASKFCAPRILGATVSEIASALRFSIRHGTFRAAPCRIGCDWTKISLYFEDASLSRGVGDVTL